MRSLWKNFKSYINELPKGEIFHRQDIINNLYVGNKPLSYIKYTSIDVFKRCSELNGVIEVVGRGSYMKLNNIPEDITLADFKYLAYTKPIYSSISIMDMSEFI